MLKIHHNSAACGGISDPYDLPCGHTFCLRPCLLPYAKTETVRCIYCHEEFDASALRPNYAVGARLCLIALQRDQEQKRGQTQERVVEDGGKGEEEELVDERGDGGNARILTRCSTCRSQTQAKLLTFCHHCYRRICVNCHAKHRDSYVERLRVKLSPLSLSKANLESQLSKLKSTLGIGKGTRGSILSAVENAAIELRTAADKALEAATTKLDVAVNADFKIADEVLCRITNLSVKVARAKDISTSITDL
ncbi:unnamed protein product, partial [Hydatigera taeniaeformis]|uniref:B box-type domain-containing protein n=1 Tax=Hydatigena taeniaeformis TaxID=6205 RepID=A0A0R3WX37_HYDTA